MSNKWIYGDADKPWEFLRFVADALEKGEELECERSFRSQPWSEIYPSEALNIVARAMRGASTVRARIKPKPLASWWKPLTDDVVLYRGDAYFDTQDGLWWTVEKKSTHFSFTDSMTHYARKADLLYGVSES